MIMTSKEFVLWLKGFTEGVHEFNVTPKQWDALKDKLAEVNDNEPFIINTPSTLPIQQPLPYIDPYNPYKITCSSGSFGTSSPGFVVTTNPGYGSITYNPSTSTTYGYPSGSAWSYTTNKPHNED